MSASRRPHHDLTEYRRQHQRIRQRVEQLVAGMTPEQFNFRPAPGRWSVGQNLEHLNLEATEQVVIVRRLVDRGRAEGVRDDGPSRHSAWGDWFVRFTEPPGKTRVRAMPRHTPSPRLSLERVAARFLALKDELLRAMEDADGLDLARLRAPLAYLPGWNPSLSLGQWLGFIAAHQRRHLYQIENVQFHPRYPDDSIVGRYMRMVA